MPVCDLCIRAHEVAEKPAPPDEVDFHIKDLGHAPPRSLMDYPRTAEEFFDEGDMSIDEWERDVDTQPLGILYDKCGCGKDKKIATAMCRICFHQTNSGPFECQDCGWLYASGNCGN